jgi:hypothetical protein
VEATDEWLVFPHELVELSDGEVARFRPRAFVLAQAVKMLQNTAKEEDHEAFRHVLNQQ